MWYTYSMKSKEHISNPEYEKEIEKGFTELNSILSDIQDKALIKDFLDCILTPTEKREITARWLLVKEINNGTPQREIAKKFNMSLCKITRGSKELKKPDSAFWKILHKN